MRVLAISPAFVGRHKSLYLETGKGSAGARHGQRSGEHCRFHRFRAIQKAISDGKIGTMTIRITPLEIPEVLLIQPRVFEDRRGFFLETYHSEKYHNAGLQVTFLQDNHSRSARNALRGLHYQLKHPQGKLIYVPSGKVFDVAVDIRSSSPTFGKSVSHILSSENHLQLYVPAGFAHGFCVLSDTADVVYKCTALYDADDDRGILWSDPDLSIGWPIQEPILSDRDSNFARLSDIPAHLLPP